MEDDPFGAIIKRCRPTSSQEVKFPNCPFACQSEVFPGEVTSLPGSSNDLNTPLVEGEFPIPPEKSQFCDKLENLENPNVDLGGDGNREELVDLGFKQICDGLFGLVDWLAENSNNEDMPVKLSTEYVCENVTLNLANQNKVVRGKSITDGVHENVEVETATKNNDVKSTTEDGGENVKVNSATNNVKLTTEGVSGNVKAKSAAKNNVKATAEGVSENVEVNWATKNVVKLTAAVNISENAKVKSATKNIEDLDKFKYVASGGGGGIQRRKDVGKKSEMLFSTGAEKENMGGESLVESCSAKNQFLNDLLEALKMLATEIGDVSEDVDFFETAKRRGLTFPRPRWWPPEGFDD